MHVDAGPVTLGAAAATFRQTAITIETSALRFEHTDASIRPTSRGEVASLPRGHLHVVTGFSGHLL